MFRNNTCYTDNEDAGFNKEDEGFVISVKRVCLTDMANVFEILIQGGGLGATNGIPTSHFRAADEVT